MVTRKFVNAGKRAPKKTQRGRRIQPKIKGGTKKEAKEEMKGGGKRKNGKKGIRGKNKKEEYHIHVA